MRLSHIFKIIGDFISGDFVSIDKLYFFGSSHRSENGRFILKWSDYDPKSRSSGPRKKGHGRYVLLDGGKIILQGKLERPNDGKVSNQGIFILNDWMFGEGSKGTFYAFDAKNKRLIRHKCDANLYNNGLSNDGQYAVCQTFYSDGEDGNMLFFFNLREKRLVWKCEPKTGWAKDYRFDTVQQVLYLLYDNGRSYRYSFDGNFLDEERWEKERINFASGYELLSIAEAKRQQLESTNADLSLYDEVIDLLKRALDKGVSENTQARIHRNIGEIYYKRGQNSKAIEHFEIAVSLNPKVGVKRLLDKLKMES